MKKKYKNPYIKHIAIDERVWVQLRAMKRELKLHSIQEVIQYILKQYK